MAPEVVKRRCHVCRLCSHESRLGLRSPKSHSHPVFPTQPWHCKPYSEGLVTPLHRIPVVSVLPPLRADRGKRRSLCAVSSPTSAACRLEGLVRRGGREGLRLS